MMKTAACFLGMAFLLQTTFLSAAETPQQIPTLVAEAKTAIERGVHYLISKQMPDGSFLNDPAFTALAIMALKGSGLPEAKQPLEKARAALLTWAKPDGSFFGKQKQYINYTTSVSLAALATLNHPDDIPQMRKTRAFIIGSQLNENNPEHPTSKDNPFYGGIGYGSGGPDRPDLSNTQWALEALYLTDHLDRDSDDSAKSELAWKNALQFLQKVQNVPANADSSWVVPANNPEQDGGFVYMPGNSKSTDKHGGETLRSYGSMTYAGLKSMLYAKLKKDDYRVRAAVDWASKHYTLDENPNMGPEGHFYYLQTFAKAHSAFGENLVKTIDGTEKNWRADLIRKIISLQQKDGSWSNSSGRWMESIPELATAYLLIALEIATP